MEIKKNIYNAIREMDANELTLLHEQIRLLKKTKTISINKKQKKLIKQVHKITGLSRRHWSDTVAVNKEKTKEILDIILPHLIL